MNDLILRGSSEVIVRKDLEAALKSGKKLRIKFGIDPTGDRIHIGHAATIRKLKYLQDAGHQIVLIVGSFTARIGDASDKTSERQIMSPEEIERNMKHYRQLLGSIFYIDKAEVHYNHEWFSRMSLDEWLRVNQLFSVAQMIERDNFAKRFENGDRIGLQEFQYPMLQGYDSVAVKADVEIGGNDQLFNLMAGRTMQKNYGQKPQHIITYELLQADDGRKMSKSWANCIWIDDAPQDMFGKVMNIKDELTMHYFTLCTEVPDDELKAMLAGLKDMNPKDLKIRLATEITTLYHGADKAGAAKEAWERQFSNKELPADIPEMKIDKPEWDTVELLLNLELAASKSEARRLIDQGGVRLNGETIKDETVTVKDGDVVQVGKRRFKRVRL